MTLEFNVERAISAFCIELQTVLNIFHHRDLG